MKNILMSDSHPTPDITSGVLTTSSLRGGKEAQGKETDGLSFVFKAFTIFTGREPRDIAPKCCSTLPGGCKRSPKDPDGNTVRLMNRTCDFEMQQRKPTGHKGHNE